MDRTIDVQICSSQHLPWILSWWSRSEPTGRTVGAGLLLIYMRYADTTERVRVRMGPKNHECTRRAAYSSHYLLKPAARSAPQRGISFVEWRNVSLRGTCSTTMLT